MQVVARASMRNSLGSRAFSTTRIGLAETTHLNIEAPLRTVLTGKALLNHPAFNKGTAFTEKERKGTSLLIP